MSTALTMHNMRATSNAALCLHRRIATSRCYRVCERRCIITYVGTLHHTGLHRHLTAPPHRTTTRPAAHINTTHASQHTQSAVDNESATPTYTVLRMMDDVGTGRLLRWHVQVGQRVEAGDILCDIDTDIAEVQYQAQYSGIIGATMVDVGGLIRAEQEIAIQVDNSQDVEYAQQMAQQLKQR